MVTEKTTVEELKALIDSIEMDSRKRLKHLRALLRVVEDETTMTNAPPENK